MKHWLLILVFLIPLLSQAKVIKASEVSWLPQLVEKDVHEFHICGNSNIQPTKASLSKHFLLGSKQTGFLFSNLISYQRYFDVLTEKNLAEAKSELEAELNNAHLWRYSKAKGFEDLGRPTKIDFRFTATIKDCVEGAKTTLGNDCSRFEGSSLRGCCGEKFVGPLVIWGEKGEYQLMYSPDPSVRLKVAGEKKHRYCNVQESVSLK